MRTCNALCPTPPAGTRQPSSTARTARPVNHGCLPCVAIHPSYSPNTHTKLPARKTSSPQVWRCALECPKAPELMAARLPRQHVSSLVRLVLRPLLVPGEQGCLGLRDGGGRRALGHCTHADAAAACEPAACPPTFPLPRVLVVSMMMGSTLSTATVTALSLPTDEVKTARRPRPGQPPSAYAGGSSHATQQHARAALLPPAPQQRCAPQPPPRTVVVPGVSQVGGQGLDGALAVHSGGRGEAHNCRAGRQRWH